MSRKRRPERPPTKRERRRQTRQKPDPNTRYLIARDRHFRRARERRRGVFGEWHCPDCGAVEPQRFRDRHRCEPPDPRLSRPGAWLDAEQPPPRPTMADFERLLDEPDDLHHAS